MFKRCHQVIHPRRTSQRLHSIVQKCFIANNSNSDSDAGSPSQRRRKKIKSSRQGERIPRPKSEKNLPALTLRMEEIIEKAIKRGDEEEVLCEGFNISLTRRDLRILNGDEWLNDQIISFYLSLIVKRSRMKGFPSVFAFNTFFFSRLVSGGKYAAVQRWTRKDDLFSYDIVLVPVHRKRKEHWCLAIIDFRCCTIFYYDPMRVAYGRCLYSLRDYLKAECLDKKDFQLDMSDWKYVHVRNAPCQEGDNDCGAFILKYAEYFCRNSAAQFDQGDVQYFRRCMVYELMVQNLL